MDEPSFDLNTPLPPGHGYDLIAHTATPEGYVLLQAVTERGKDFMALIKERYDAVGLCGNDCSIHKEQLATAYQNFHNALKCIILRT